MENKTPAVTEHKDSIICPNCGTGLSMKHIRVSITCVCSI